MKKMVSIALAGALAASVMGASTVSASAYHRHGHYHHNHRSYDPGPAVAVGAIFGLAVGAFSASVAAPFGPYRAPPAYIPGPPAYAPYPVLPARGYQASPGRSPHSDWCASQYPSYDHGTNTWVDYQGVRQPCFSPY